MKMRALSLMLTASIILTLGGCSDNERNSAISDTQTTSSSTNVSAAITTLTEEPEDTTTTAVEQTVATLTEQTSTETFQSTTTSTATTTSAPPATSEERSPVESKPAHTTATTTQPTQTTVQTTATTQQTQPAIQTTTAISTTVSTIPEPVPTVPAHTDIYEAENAQLFGSLSILDNSSFSGGKAVGNFSDDSDRICFTIDIPANGIYDITFVSSGIGSYKENNVAIDGIPVGMFSCENEQLTESVIPSVSLSKGKHDLTITRSWGWIRMDCIKIEAAKGIDDSIYNVSDKLINENANAQTKALFSYLSESYGKYILSGQVCDDGLYGKEFTAIYNETGKYPAILGLDMMDYTPSRTALGARTSAVDRAIEFGKKGGIVTFCWHWNAPTEYLKNGNDDNGNPRWWGGFYTRNSTFDIAKVMNGQDPEGKKAIDRDIKEIASQLKRLEDAGVPVIWRPLHEASGGWFWWGAKGADAYKKLWIYLYEELTYKYGCNNLIWVFNAQDSEWYPGDEYVDVIGEDIYPGEHVYSPQTAKFKQATAYSDSNKIVALTENGCIFDIDQAVEINAMWLWFCTWGGEFAANGSVYSEKFTEVEILKKAYDSKYVITLDELPDLY